MWAYCVYFFNCWYSTRNTAHQFKRCKKIVCYDGKTHVTNRKAWAFCIKKNKQIISHRYFIENVCLWLYFFCMTRTDSSLTPMGCMDVSCQEWYFLIWKNAIAGNQDNNGLYLQLISLIKMIHHSTITHFLI